MRLMGNSGEKEGGEELEMERERERGNAECVRLFYKNAFIYSSWKGGWGGGSKVKYRL